MRITCPYCGSRDLREFTFHGEACEARRGACEAHEASEPSQASAPVDATYLRDNPAGRSTGWWTHDQGCRSWLLIERDNRTHEIFSVSLARQEAGQ